MISGGIFFLVLLVPLLAWGAVELDVDDNDAIDITYGGTNATTAAGARTALGVAPSDAHYLTDQAEAGLSAEVVVTANGKSLVTAADYAAMRVLLGVGSYIQAWDADLDTYAGITPSANVQSLLAAADYAAMRVLLTLTIGTNVQAWDADLDTWATITPSDDIKAFNAVADYDAARTALGLKIGTDVQAYNAGLTAWTAWADPGKTALLQWDDVAGAFAIYAPTAWSIPYSGASSAPADVALGAQYTLLQSGGPAAPFTFTSALNWDPLIAPNGANPTTDAAGEIAVDTSAAPGSMLRWYGDAAYATPAYQAVSSTIKTPTAADDYPLWKFPYAITIRNIKVYCVGGTSITGGLDECTGTLGVCSSHTDVDADIVSLAGTEVADDGALTNGAIAAGNYIQWHTTSIDGTPTSVTVTIYYTVDQVN